VTTRFPSAAETLARNRQRAVSFAQRAGQQRLQVVLERSARELSARVAKIEGTGGAGADSYSAVQTSLALDQVRDVLRGLRQGLGNVVLDAGDIAAEQSASGTLDYIQNAEARFRGSARPLALSEAAIVDQAVSGTQSSMLRRLASDPKHPASKGILDRYGDAVVGHFEDVLQQRLIQRTPWEEVKKQLVEKSPFLQGAPAHWAERIVRTETMYANNRASAEAMQATNAAIGGDMLKILCATFDDRTGADSIAVHGQIRRMEEPFDTWYGAFMHPPDRPNDREVVVPHRASWPLPKELLPRSDAEVRARWAKEGRKGSPPARPKMSTVDLAALAEQASQTSPPAVPQPPQKAEPPREEQPRPAPEELRDEVPQADEVAPMEPRPAAPRPPSVPALLPDDMPVTVIEGKSAAQGSLITQPKGAPPREELPPYVRPAPPPTAPRLKPRRVAPVPEGAPKPAPRARQERVPPLEPDDIPVTVIEGKPAAQGSLVTPPKSKAESKAEPSPKPETKKPKQVAPSADPWQSFVDAAKTKPIVNAKTFGGAGINQISVGEIDGERVFVKPETVKGVSGAKTTFDPRDAVAMHEAVRKSAEAIGVGHLIQPATFRSVAGEAPSFVTRGASEKMTPLAAASEEDVRKVTEEHRLAGALIDFLHKNADRHDENVLVAPDGAITLIDHDRIHEHLPAELKKFSQARSVFFPEGPLGYTAPQRSLADLPAKMRQHVEDLMRMSDEEVAKTFGLAQAEAAAMRGRAKAVADKGLDEALYVDYARTFKDFMSKRVKQGGRK